MTADPTREFVEAVRAALATYDKRLQVAQDPAQGMPFDRVELAIVRGRVVVELAARVRSHLSGEAFDVWPYDGDRVTIAIGIVLANTKGYGYLTRAERALMAAHHLGYIPGTERAEVSSPSLGPSGVR